MPLPNRSLEFSRPFGTYATPSANPGVETPGYCRASLRDSVFQ